MKYSDRYSILITMAATYVVTLGILWWQRKPHQIVVPTAYIVAVPRVEPARVVTPAPAEPDQSPEARPPAGQPVRAAMAANDGPPPNSTGPDLPVTLYIVPATVSIKEEGPDGAMRMVNKNVNEAIISNDSDHVLTITAIDVNPSTGESAQAEFTLGQNGQRHLNIGDGVNLLAGDQLTLRSPTFRDRTEQIP